MVTVVAGCAAGDRSLQTTVREAVRAAPGSGATAYRSPSSQAAHELAMTVAALAVGAQVDRPPAGYRVTRPRAEGGDTLVALEETPEDGQVPGHGLYVLRPGAAGAVVVQVPHPVADRSTAVLGADLFEQAEAGVLMVAGAHRRAGDGSADVAHQAGSAFAAVDRAVVGRGTEVVQLHGFAAENHPESYGDVVLSSTRRTPSPLVLDLAAALRAADFRVCVYDGDRCSRLAGTDNVQGAHARAVGADFAHVEVSDAVRADDDRAAAFVAALARGMRTERGAGRRR